eukprot:6477189-Amphidinium_carterae.1
MRPQPSKHQHAVPPMHVSESTYQSAYVIRSYAALLVGGWMASSVFQLEFCDETGLHSTIPHKLTLKANTSTKDVMFYDSLPFQTVNLSALAHQCDFPALKL